MIKARKLKIDKSLLQKRQPAAIPALDHDSICTYTYIQYQRKVGHKKIKREAKKCTALILVPTRELAIQVNENIKLYGKKIKPKCS